MSVPPKIFLDANVLVYAQDTHEPDKQETSRSLIAGLAASGTGVISTQVLQEFYVATTGKLGVPPLAAKAILKTFSVFEIIQVSPSLIDDAVDCSVLNHVSFWDALILAAAASAGCTAVHTEDMNAGQMVLGVTIENPFTGSTSAV
jgi:predicted nucleic acid-binding protein